MRSETGMPAGGTSRLTVVGRAQGFSRPSSLSCAFDTQIGFSQQGDCAGGDRNSGSFSSSSAKFPRVCA